MYIVYTIYTSLHSHIPLNWKYPCRKIRYVRIIPHAPHSSFYGHVYTKLDFWGLRNNAANSKNIVQVNVFGWLTTVYGCACEFAILWKAININILHIRETWYCSYVIQGQWFKVNMLFRWDLMVWSTIYLASCLEKIFKASLIVAHSSSIFVALWTHAGQSNTVWLILDFQNWQSTTDLSMTSKSSYLST